MQAPTTNDWKAGFPLTGSPVYLDSETAATLLSDPANLESCDLNENYLCHRFPAAECRHTATVKRLPNDWATASQ